MPRASKLVNCLQCGVEFSKSLKEIKRSPNNFCSRSCSVSFQNIHTKTITKRSKFEKKIAELLTEHFKDLKIEYNDRKTIGLELDVLIPSLSVAFEFNGVSHYKPVYGEAALQKTKAHDAEKKRLCAEKNIKLIVVDTSDMPHFKFYKMRNHFELIKIEIEKQIQK